MLRALTDAIAHASLAVVVFWSALEASVVAMLMYSIRNLTNNLV